MKKVANAALLGAVAITALHGQSIAPRSNLLDDKSKTIWLSDRTVSVGDIFRTDPATWSKKYGAQFNFMVGIGDRLKSAGLLHASGVGSESVHAASKADIALVLPILKLVGLSAATEHTVDATFNDVSFAYVDSYLDMTNMLRALDTGGRSQKESQVFGMMRTNGAAANGTARQSSYWIVTQVYGAGAMDLKTSSGHAFSGGLGCTTPPTATIPTAASGDANSTTPKAAGTPNPSSTSKPKPEKPATPAVSFGSSLSPTGQLVGSVQATVGPSAASPATNQSGTAKAQAGCTLASGSIAGAKTGELTRTNAVIAVKVVPVYYNGVTFRIPDESEVIKYKPRAIVGS